MPAFYGDFHEGIYPMLTLPATYLEVRAAFILRKQLFSTLAAELGCTDRYIRIVLKTYWGRDDFAPESELAKKILARVEAILRQPIPKRSRAITYPSSDIDSTCHIC